VHKILNSARLADLSVERPTKFELATNFKAAKALGLDLPSMLLARADEVIIAGQLCLLLAKGGPSRWACPQPAKADLRALTRDSGFAE
jgi:hypothetical protein